MRRRVGDNLASKIRAAILAVAVLALASPAAADWIQGGRFNVVAPRPAGGTAGGNATNSHGYGVRALGPGECACVDTDFPSYAANAWTCAPRWETADTSPTNINACFVCTASAYRDTTDLTAYGTPTGVQTNDTNAGGNANNARLAPASAAFTVYDVLGAGACTGTNCQGTDARFCVCRTSATPCDANELAGDALINAVVLDKVPE